MTSYGSATYPPPKTRSRGSSTASRYTPDAYKTPEQLQQPPMSNGYPFPNGMAPQQQPVMPPVHAYGPIAGQAIPPQNTLHPAAAANPPYPIGEGVMPVPLRPINEPERCNSHSSHRSHKSHDSRRSRDSQCSHKSHHSYRTSSEEQDRRHRRQEHQRRKSDSYYDKSIKRRDTHRPTMGDSLFSLFDTLKSALGPRDKY